MKAVYPDSYEDAMFAVFELYDETGDKEALRENLSAMV